eukprot:gene277-6692_t
MNYQQLDEEVDLNSTSKNSFSFKNHFFRSTFCCGSVLYLFFFFTVISFSIVSYVYVNLPYVDRSKKISHVRLAVDYWSIPRILMNITTFSASSNLVPVRNINFDKKYDFYVNFYTELSRSEYIPPYAPILFKNEESLVSTLITNDNEMDIDLTLSTSLGRLATVKRNFIKKENEKTLILSCLILVPDLTNKTLSTFQCDNKGISDKANQANYIPFKQEFIGKPYKIPIYILHKNSPDLVYHTFIFGFGIDDKLSSIIFNVIAVSIICLSIISFTLMTVSFHHQKILIADMLNSKMIFPPLYIVSMMMFYIEVIQIILTSLFSLDLSKEFGFGSVFTGDLLLLRHYVNSYVLRILYFLFKSSTILISIVINVKYKKTKTSLTLLSLCTGMFTLLNLIYPLSLLSYLFVDMSPSNCQLGTMTSIGCIYSINESTGRTVFIFLQLFRNFIGCVLLLMIPIPLILFLLSKNDDLSYYGWKIKKYIEHTKNLFDTKTEGNFKENIEKESLVNSTVKLTEKLDNEENLKYSTLFKISMKLKYDDLKKKMMNLIKPKKTPITHLPIQFGNYFYPLKFQVAAAMGLSSVFVVVCFLIISAFYSLAYITKLVERYLIPLICKVKGGTNDQCVNSLTSYINGSEVFLYISFILSGIISIIVIIITLYQLAGSFKEKILNVRRGEVKLELANYSLVNATQYIGYQAAYIGYSGLLFFFYAQFALIILSILFQFFLSFLSSFLPPEIRFIYESVFQIIKQVTMIALSNEAILVPIISFLIFTIGYSNIVHNIAKLYFPVFETKYIRNIYIFSVYDQFSTIYSSLVSPITIGITAPFSTLVYYLLYIARLDHEDSVSHYLFKSVLKTELIYNNPVLSSFAKSCEIATKTPNSKKILNYLLAMIHISKLNPFFVKELQTSWDILNYQKSGKLDKSHLEKCLNSYDFTSLDIDSILKNETISQEYFTYGDFINILYTHIYSMKNDENIESYLDLIDGENIEVKSLLKVIDIYFIGQEVDIITEIKEKFEKCESLISIKELKNLLE